PGPTPTPTPVPPSGPTDPQIAKVEARSAFLDAQMLFDLDEEDIFAFFDWYYWNDFTVTHDRGTYRVKNKGGKDILYRDGLSSYEVVESKGLSIRRRKAEMLKNTNSLRGFY
ncbi:MAG: hypothetical protein HKM07_05770, partial [Chlamydiae bacterium]|nr:hypothetical protein [Chlamydiota bacterium]